MTHTPRFLTGSHSRTYDAIFRHPIAHNIAWHDVHTLLSRLGELVEEPNGHLKATRNGESMVLPAARTKEVGSAEEVMALRHFLERSETKPEASGESREAHWLLVIDHRVARLFRTELQDASPVRISPHEPADFFRHAQDSLETARGKEKPDPNSYFQPVFRALGAPGPILIFGTGTGTSSEMDQFVNWVRQHQPLFAARIIGTVVVDEHHLTEGQLLAKARDYYEALQDSAAEPTL